MSKASPHLADSLDARLEALAGAASILGWPLPRERDEAVCAQMARCIDALLVRVARGWGALAVSLGERLDALAIGDRVLRLGYSGIGDYAREELGIAASTAQKMARLARGLRDRPLLRAAVRAGEVTVRHAEAVLPVARGEAEAAWVARARTETVRALKAAVKDPAACDPEEDEEWTRIRTPVPAESRPVLDEAMALGQKMVGATAPKGAVLRGMFEEYLGAHPAPDDDGTADSLLPAPAAELMEPIKEWLEKETAQWAFLGQAGPVAAPGDDPDEEIDPWRLHRELRQLAEMRERWDEVLGHLAMLFRAMDGWRRLGFASFGHYCEERLAMCPRAVEQRAALERRLYELPPLRQAMQERRLSYEKARLVARYADEASVESWIERAESMPCIQLRRELQGVEETQMCARGEFNAWVPRSVAGLFALACGAARKAAGRWLSPGECLGRIAAHCVEVWKPQLAERNTVQKRVLERDRGFCQAPGCSRPAVQVHHILFRSAGGSDDPANLISLCAAHHLHGVHMGYLGVRGKAPDALRWQLGSRGGVDPRTDSRPR